jgi:DNA-binding NtrC family response regulator
VSALDAIIGKSGVVRALKENIARFAPLDAPVLVTGETGTGKELAARALHEESPRCREPFIAVNCGSITDTLLESELFGHERGAFTGADKANKGIFEEAGKGTVFLDEIGSISPRLQGSLLRVLETGEARAVGSPRARTVQCRIVAATNVPLETLVSGGQFRSDLFFRLKRLEVSVPTLRERREDIPLLVRHFLDAGRPLGQHAAMARQLESRFIEYEWPGNVRELRNVVERMRLLHSDKMLYDLPDVDIKLLHTAPAPAPAAPEPAGAPPAAPAPAPANRASPAASFQATDRDVGAVLAESRSAVRRVERLKELFEQHSKLTRSEIIRITGVSPNTATKDLKALCDEGFVRRVEPSSSSRSYYFERVG